MAKAPRTGMLVLDANRLRKARDVAGLTVEDVARELHVAEKTVRRMEKSGVLKPKHLDALERLYRVKLAKRPDISTDAKQPAQRATPAAGDGEFAHIIDSIRRAGTRLAMRQSQGAPADEVLRLKRELAVAYRNALELKAVTGNWSELADAFADLKESETPPPPKPRRAPTTPAAKRIGDT